MVFSFLFDGVTPSVSISTWVRINVPIFIIYTALIHNTVSDYMHISFVCKPRPRVVDIF